VSATQHVIDHACNDDVAVVVPSVARILVLEVVGGSDPDESANATTNHKVTPLDIFGPRERIPQTDGVQSRFPAILPAFVGVPRCAPVEDACWALQ